jgi:hypothetical protein
MISVSIERQRLCAHFQGQICVEAWLHSPRNPKVSREMSICGINSIQASRRRDLGYVLRVREPRRGSSGESILNLVGLVQGRFHRLLTLVNATKKGEGIEGGCYGLERTQLLG